MSWYTGSAAWLYRVALEAILGVRLQGQRLVLEPCVPGHWPAFGITYRYRGTTYRITVENPQGVERGVSQLFLDGQPREGHWVDLVDDGANHEVRVVLG